MLTPQDVRAAQFEKNIRGYRTEEVDRFLDKVEEQLKQDEDQAEELRRQIAELTAENQRLHKEMESYEADGDMLKSALINAQRMGENVIREANQKSEEILHRANLRGDDIIRDANELLQKASDRADEIINEANEKKLAQEREYDRVRLEVTRFKSDVLNLYRSHVESLSRLPEFQKEEPAEDAPAEDEAAAAETTAAAVTEEIAEAQPAAADVDAEDETPADEKTSEEFWAQDESQLKLDPPPAPAAEDEAAAPDYAAFKGVKFSDHHIQSPLAMIDRTCQTCHRESEETLRNNVYERQRKANEIRNRLEQELAKAHIEAKFAWDKGATEEQMKEVLALIRQAQWRWDFGVASHGGAFHAPQEIQRVLSHGLDRAMQARLAVSKVLAKHGYTDNVPMPDISTKDKAQEYIGLDMDAERAAKDKFLKTTVPAWLEKAKANNRLALK